MPKIIEVIYENGVFKPLEKVDLKEKTRIKITIGEGRREVIESYRGVFGRADTEELREFEEEAQVQW
ncbi:antitoxin family protein [Archaeoglobus veneficus]|uniref:Antitoxin n=1 Tax=Archaeoglobus veneficus (strain DSM 11195 / SNP6) TaxID=693661 RepID=F2KQD8_ARCVS|nr:antitoxin family protein [Archaeoglobus veneficus]AEA46571.1 protein of unknown function DUF104 [Archaeoglobus veneficus SNP6]